MDRDFGGILDGKFEMTVEEYIALLEKGPIKQENEKLKQESEKLKK